MSKSTKILAGVAALGMAALPFAGFASAADNIAITDKLELTIEDNCAFTRDVDTPHSAGSWTTEGTTDTLSTKVTNGSTNDNFAKSKFKVVCNNVHGYQVTVAPTGFTAAEITGAEDFAYNAGGYKNDASSWYIGGLQTASENLVKKETAATAGTTFEVSYNAKVSATQQADTYNAQAIYTFAQLNS